MITTFFFPPFMLIAGVRINNHKLGECGIDTCPCTEIGEKNLKMRRLKDGNK